MIRQFESGSEEGVHTFSKVLPGSSLSDAGRDRGMMRNLLAEISVLLLQIDVFKRFSLRRNCINILHSHEAAKTDEHRIERLGDSSDCRGVIRHSKRGDVGDPSSRIRLKSSSIHYRTLASVNAEKTEEQTTYDIPRIPDLPTFVAASTWVPDHDTLVSEHDRSTGMEDKR